MIIAKSRKYANSESIQLNFAGESCGSGLSVALFGICKGSLAVRGGTIWVLLGEEVGVVLGTSVPSPIPDDSASIATLSKLNCSWSNFSMSTYLLYDSQAIMGNFKYTKGASPFVLPLLFYERGNPLSCSPLFMRGGFSFADFSLRHKFASELASL